MRKLFFGALVAACGCVGSQRAMADKPFGLKLSAEPAESGYPFLFIGKPEPFEVGKSSNIRVKSGDFRVSPGLGLRIMVPALAAAPIALDLSAPIEQAEGDRVYNSHRAFDIDPRLLKQVQRAL